jgi:hypothetical protein
MRTLRILLGCLIAGLVCWGRSQAGLPLPSLTFYGLFTDEYGWPYSTDDLVEVDVDGARILSQKLGSANGRDYNYVVRVPYDSGGRGGDYNHDVVAPGERLTIRLLDRSTGKTVVSTNFICNLLAGSVVRLDLSSGTDSLQDGLPDSLREWIWDALGDGNLFEPGRVRATADSDGDGVINLDEYRAGTDPANAEDLLNLEIQPVEGVESVQLKFFTVPGKTYRLENAQWTEAGVVVNPARFASHPAGEANIREVMGTGRGISIFVPTSGDPQFLRLVVAPRPSGGRILP